MIRIEDLEKIIRIVENHEISHFEFEQDDSRVVIEKNDSIGKSADLNAGYESKGGYRSEEDKVLSDCESSIKKQSVNLENFNTDNNVENKKSESDYIKSSLAGTFYLKKDENSEPFVKVGDEVKEDTIVGLVEVMKLFNEIEAHAKGIITKILVKDGEFIEYGQPLFEIEK